MLELTIRPAKSDDGKIVLYMAVENLSENDISIAGARPAFNPKITDAEGYNYTPGVAYTAVVRHLRIPAGKAYTSVSSYQTVEEKEERWDGLLHGDHNITIIHDPREKDTAEPPAEIHAGINPNWDRELTVEFSLEYEGNEYTDTENFTPAKVEKTTYESFKEKFDSTEEAKFI